MMKTWMAAAGALTMFSACLFAQGLNTKASKTDWEEINFEFNSSVLSDGYPSLLRLADLLSQHRDYRVQVTGNADYVGGNRYNQRLSLARANTVKEFLVKYGAGADQVTTSGNGERSPEVSNKTKEGRFMNRRVLLKVTDGQGRVVGDGTIGEIGPSLADLLKKQEECCNNILKRLDKLDDILAALRDLKGENDRLKSDLAALKEDEQGLRRQVEGLPKPLSKEETTQIATNEGNRVLDEAAKRNKKFTLLGLNVGPTFGPARTGDFTFSGRGQFFSPFGGYGKSAVQAQGEYMYYPDRQEGQFDIGLIHRWSNFQAGLFSSEKYLQFKGYQQGGWLGQGAFVADYLFSRGRIGIFGTKAYKSDAVLNSVNLGPQSFLQTYAHVVDQIGASTQLGLWGDAYVEANLAYLKLHGMNDKPGGMFRVVQPLNDQFALTGEFGYNETYVGPGGSGRVAFGFQYGNMIRPKDYTTVSSPVPMDIPRIRYELLTRRVGNSPPVADAGPDQVGVQAGTITLNGSGSYDPEGDPITYQWTQVSGPSVSISNANAAVATFTAAANSTYAFRLKVTDNKGLYSYARTTVSSVSNNPLRIISFAANPPAVAPGGASTLSWQVQGADSVTISPSVGKVDPVSGSTAVSPSQTTDYTLTATQGSQTITQTVRVTVNVPGAAAIVSFNAQPTNINKGEAATLTWQTQNATDVSISGIGTVPANGSRAVTPDATTTYTLTARDAQGRSVTATATITVNANGGVPRVLLFSSTPTSTVSGGQVQLCYSVENATTISISPTAGNQTNPTGCLSVAPTATTTYTLTATNGSGTTTAAAVVVVNTQLAITSFSNSPAYSPAAGAPVVLSWTTTGASSVSITGPFVPGGQLPANGSLTINPTTNADYTLTAYGPNGQTVTSVVHVFVR
jgi:hypothetical protein